jgi:hypothetical protein
MVMQLPVHRDQLMLRATTVSKDEIRIKHSYYGEKLEEVWCHFYGPWFYWKETIKLNEPNSEVEIILEDYREFVKAIRKTHEIYHGSLPCKCSIGKAFEKLDD